MLRKIKLKNSTGILVGFIFVFIGILLGFYEYFLEKKNNAYSEMNIMLYENEMPENVTSEELKIDEIVEENDSEEKKDESNINNNSTSYLGILEIPKIGVRGGFYNLGSRLNNVDYNITLIKGSTFPDQENSNLILAAHSGICPVCYFDNLYKLEVGDKATINYKSSKYTYSVVNIYQVTKDGTVTIHRKGNKKTLTLITCTRNTNNKQTVYILEIV